MNEQRRIPDPPSGQSTKPAATRETCLRKELSRRYPAATAPNATPRRSPAPWPNVQPAHRQSSPFRRLRRWTERVGGEFASSTAARQASATFAITLFLSLCGWSPSFAQQADGNWMREHVRLRVLARNLRAMGAQTGRLGGNDLTAVVRPKIVGGTEGGAADNPFQVALLRRNIANNRDAQFCGGTLVRQSFILTAAHCSDFVTANQVQVLTGTRRLDGTGDRRDVSRIVIHPSWNATTFDHDVAIWELSSNATGIPLATLATEDGPAGGNLLATGWGETEAGPLPIALRRVEVPLVAEANCNDANSYNGAITGRMLCAGRDGGGQDTCQGDSGGPLTRGANNSVITGITSWGIGCADPNLFGVYTRVSDPVIRNFIESSLEAGTGDIVWQHVFGQVHYWRMQNGQRQGGFDVGGSGPVGNEWVLRGIGDVNGDGTDDIVWQHVFGQVHYWPMQNGQRQGGFDVGSSGPVGNEWVLRGVGDVNGDGTDDIVWQHIGGQVHYWPMQNGQRQGGFDVGSSGPVGNDWVLRGVGDVNGDGTDDIVWQHIGGQAHYWPMQNGQRQGGFDVGGSGPVGNDWVLRGVGDVNGDGTDDIVWQHIGGQAHYWPMQNGQRQGGFDVGGSGPIGNDWVLRGVGDVD